MFTVSIRTDSPEFDVFLTVHHSTDFFQVTNLMHTSFYSITIYMLHYNAPHVSSSTLPIFRRTNCIITTSGIVTLQTAVQYAGWERTAVHSGIVSSYQLNAHFLYSVKIRIWHYNPQHVSSSTMLIFRRTNCIITASGIVTPCKRPYSMPIESGLQSTLELFQITNLMHTSFIV